MFLIPVGIILGLIILGSWVQESGELLYGEWDCGSNIKVSFMRNKSFEMYNSNDKNDMDIIGQFTIDEVEQDGSDIEYTITMKTNNRTLLGQKFTDEYTTQYAITMDSTSQKEIAMMNTISSNIYICEKTK